MNSPCVPVLDTVQHGNHDVRRRLCTQTDERTLKCHFEGLITRARARHAISPLILILR